MPTQTIDRKMPEPLAGILSYLNRDGQTGDPKKTGDGMTIRELQRIAIAAAYYLAKWIILKTEK